MSDDSAAVDLRIICGPTGAGKSAVALRLARRHGLQILSADSRQIYRHFDVGTAKPSVAERRDVPHHGIDVAEPTERWSAARWATDAEDVLHRIGVRRVIVVGGTGLWLRALTTPLFREPALDPPRRAALQRQLGTLSRDALRRWVAQLDPARAHLGRTQLLRAIEVALLTGRPLSAWHADAAPAAPASARWLVLDPGEALATQLEERLDAMLVAGWLDEVRALATTVPDTAPAWQGCGYAALVPVARGTRALNDARSAILIATRQYAKRQRTWFRHQLPPLDGRVTRLDPRERTCDERVEQWWLQGDSA